MQQVKSKGSKIMLKEKKKASKMERLGSRVGGVEKSK